MAGYIGSKAVSLSTTAADVTGDAEIGGDLTVDTNTLYVDSTNNQVGIGETSPAAQLHVKNSGGNSVSIVGQYGTGTRAQISAFANQVEFRAYNGTNDVMTFKTGSTERMRIDTSGRVTMPYQPAFLARLNTNWSHPSGAVQLGGTWVTDLNVGSHYSTSTRRFTAPVAGKYQFNTTVATEGSVSNIAYISSEIWVNGTRKYVGGWDSGGSSYNKSSASYVVDLNANDYVTIGSEISVSCNLTSSTHTTLSGYLIG